MVLPHDYVLLGRNACNERKPIQSLHWPEAPEVHRSLMLVRLHKHMKNVMVGMNINTWNFERTHSSIYSVVTTCCLCYRCDS